MATVTDHALSQVIDHQLRGRPMDELIAAYRAICGMVLLRTTTVQRLSPKASGAEIVNRRVAKRWLAGRGGVITLEQACEALEMSVDAVREGILKYAEAEREEAIRRKRLPKTHFVFGRNYHDPGRQDQTASGVAPCPPTPVLDCCERGQGSGG